MIGSVYIIESEKSIKIGCSKNPIDRVSSIKRTGGISKSLRSYISPEISNYYEIEAKVHNWYSSFRLNGEWFSVSYDDACDHLNTLISKIGKRGTHVKINPAEVDYQSILNDWKVDGLRAEKACDEIDLKILNCFDILSEFSSSIKKDELLKLSPVDKLLFVIKIQDAIISGIINQGPS